MATFGGAAFAAGPYSVTMASVAVGLMQGDQQTPVFEEQKSSQIIRGTHLWGQTPIGSISQGGEAFAGFTLMEYLPTSLATFWPYGSLGAVPTVGFDEYDSYAGALVLTAASGTRAATTGPATVTGSKAVLQEGFALRFLYSPMLREIPIRMRLFPDASNTNRFWVLT